MPHTCQHPENEASLKSAAFLSISSLSLCLSPCVLCVGVRGLRRVFVSHCVWSKRNEK